MSNPNTTEARSLARQLARQGQGDPAWETAAQAAGIGLGTWIASRQAGVLDANGYITRAWTASQQAAPAPALAASITPTASQHVADIRAGRPDVDPAEALARVTRWAPVGLSEAHTAALAGIAQLRTPEPQPGSFFPCLSLWQAVAASQLAGDPFPEPLLLIGDPGLGKSAGIVNLAAVLGIPLERLPFGVRLDPADVFGEETLLGGSVVARPGKLPVAMMDGSWILYDEIASAPEGTLAHFFEVLEPGGALAMPWATYRPTPGFRQFSTDNAAGTDLSGRMTHSRSCSPALLSRHQGITLPRPTAADWSRILPGTTGCGPNWAAWMADFSTAVWVLWDKGELSQSWGIREAQRLVRLVLDGGCQPADALSQAFGFKLPARERKTVDQLAQRILPPVWPEPLPVTADAPAAAEAVMS